MIIDNLKNALQYYNLDANFVKGLTFVAENHKTIAPGKYFIDGDNLFVSIVESDMKTVESAKLEAHNLYIDIQIVLQGSETFGWAEREQCHEQIAEFDTTKDICFYKDKPSTYVTLKENQFVIFAPEDAHAPLIGEGKIRKAIIKIKRTTW